MLRIVAVGADDLALRVDPRDEGGRGAGEIDHGERLFVLQETMESSSVIDVAAHGPAAVVDAEGHGVQPGAGASMVVKTPLSRHEAMALEADIPVVVVLPFLMFGAAGFLVCKSDCCRDQQAESECRGNKRFAQRRANASDHLVHCVSSSLLAVRIRI